MKVVAAEWLPYRLPLKRPWQTSQGVLKERSGSLLRLETEDGETGWGDCAPLPEFGINEMNATSFAEELAHLDLFSQKLGQPLNSCLSNTAAVTSVAVNANLGSISDTNQGLVETALKSGFSILKIKVGLGHWQDEVEHLLHLCDGLSPGASLRLDANMAWSEAEAGLFIRACTHLPIEGLEEPLRRPDHGGLARLQNLAPFPIAIDESIHLIDQAFFHHPPTKRLVLKPARFGGLLKTMEIALRTQASGIECIVTSSLESNCGLLACAHLAAVIGPKAVHGLGSAEWFTENTSEEVEVRDGRMLLPTLAGLGFSPHPGHQLSPPRFKG